MNQKRNIPISLPSLGEEEWMAVKEPLMTGWITSGPKVREFEDAFAKRHCVNHAIAVTSATTALHLALHALGIGPDDEVIVPAFTWVSTANAVLYQGAKVVFCDVNKETFNINAADLRNLITEKTKAIIVVHLFGLCANIEEIKSVAKDIPIIEDGACAAGSSYKGVPAGSLGKIGCFSFHPRKSITTGEGGMITTNDNFLAEKLAVLRNHGASISEEQRHHGSKPYVLPDFAVMGFNYRMTDIQAAIGIVQLQKLDFFILERERWANYYIEHLKEIKWLSLPFIDKNYQHGWQSFVTMIDENSAPFPRNKIMEKLQEKGISTRPGTHAVHMLSFYSKKFDLIPENYPGARDCNNYSMAIPLHNKMEKEDYDYVIDCLKNLS